MPDSEAQELPVSVLSPDEPAPCELVNPDGKGRVVLICEHGGRLVPRALNDLGLARDVFGLHIGWDIGAAGVAREMSRLLDAPLLLQRYSRLVIDCNRSLRSPDLIPEVADGVVVPGNQNLSAAARQARYDTILKLFHDNVARLLDSRDGRQDTVLLMIHSFTPKLMSRGTERQMQLGLLYNRDPRLGRALAKAIRADNPELTVAENAPYQCSDLTDYAVPFHAEPRGLLHALVEIRNDQILSAEAQLVWARILVRGLERALETLEETNG